MTAYDFRRAAANTSVAQVNVTTGARSRVSRSTFNTHNASIVVMSSYKIEHGVFSEKPDNISSDVYGLSLIDDSGKKIDVRIFNMNFIFVLRVTLTKMSYV